MVPKVSGLEGSHCIGIDQGCTYGVMVIMFSCCFFVDEHPLSYHTLLKMVSYCSTTMCYYWDMSVK